ncbi:MBL fold metallo-hydrolase [Macromonas nakdongensis]|uniref:MBL fold metallo-hydrolase n=1 Tax=Macromonas nakdongensis TaxID=1843082 RepID=UPI000C32BE70|nr:MBL fold metallo-hydrolase [Macromonas nakdongensis]
MTTTADPRLPPGLSVFERGWLSANNVLGLGPEGATLVDSGYASHSDQTLALVDSALAGRPLARLLNTHLHSDHCGGNAALQARYPGLHTAIPPGEADAVRAWDETRLSYRPTGQTCPRFAIDAVLAPGTEVPLAGLPWQVLAAPGHDPHAVLLFQPDWRVLISGDALWENGFGVVFPELEGQRAFDEVGDTLELIAGLRPRTVIPGHGRVFGGDATAVDAALDRARSRLAQFRRAPAQHTAYAAKVLLKFKLMEFRRIARDDFAAWALRTPYLQGLHAQTGTEAPAPAWLQGLLAALETAGALHASADGWLEDR